MRYQSLFSLKNKKNISKCCLLKFYSASVKSNHIYITDGNISFIETSLKALRFDKV